MRSIAAVTGGEVCGLGIVGYDVVALLEGAGVGGGILEVPVGVVLDDDDVVFDAEGVYGLPAGDAKGAGGWVLADPVWKNVGHMEDTKPGWGMRDLRDGIDHVRTFATACVPILEHVEQSVGPLCTHALVVDGDGNDVETSRSGGLDGVHVGELFD